MMTIKDTVQYIKDVAEHTYNKFLEVGKEGTGIIMVAPRIGIEFDYYPERTLKEFSSMMKYYQVCVFNAMKKAGWFQANNVSINVVKRELGITDNELGYIMKKPDNTRIERMYYR